MRRHEFEKLVLEALAKLPAEFQDQLDNLDVVVKWRPSPTERHQAGSRSGDALFGLYLGVPLSERGAYYNMALPDKIVIYQETHERLCSSREEMVEEIRKTVLHELGHYLGIDEERLEELDLG
ncbi:MAG: metallopeptidase family protein [Dehalococcoidia bacterium]